MSLDPAGLALYLVTDTDLCRAAGHTVPSVVSAAVRAGVRAVQVRAKDASGAAFLGEVLEVADAIAGVPGGERVDLYVNDRVDVALAARAAGARVAGVHLGQSDLPAAAARRILWPGALIGVSVVDDDTLRAVEAADYLGIGPLRDTATKPDAERALGRTGVAALARAATVPAVAIGGISAADLPRLRADGLAGAAVVSAICAAADPERAARDLLRAWNERTHP